MASVERLCANGSCEKAGKHLCSGCNEELYCSRDCQKSHWLLHKRSCLTATKPVAVSSFDSLSAKQLKNLLKVKAAGFDKDAKKTVLDLLDQIVEKPQLVALVAEHVKLSEIESLLSISDGANGKSSSGSSSSSSSSSSGSRNQTAKKSKDTSSKNSGHPTQPVPTPDQLRQQAAMIRKDPQSIRRANVAFAKMTDDQIRAYADQLEQAASDPVMMKEVERMAQLSPKEREQLQSIQDGLQGNKPMDDAWLDSAISTLKTNPGFYKNMVKGKGAMFGGVSDAQIESFVDTAATMDAITLRRILKAIMYLATWAKPLTDTYNYLDKKSFGFAKHIMLGIAAIIIYNSVLFWIGVWRYVLSYIFGWKAVEVAAVTASRSAASEVISPAAKVLAEAGVASVLSKTAEDAISGAIPAATAKIPAATESLKAKAGKAAKDEAADMEFSF